MLCTWLAQSIAARDFLDADAISYLDISYSCLGGNWHSLVNGYWSPGYPFLLAIWVKLFKVGPFREPLAVHLFAVTSLVVALIAFEYFLSVLFSFRAEVAEGTSDESYVLSQDVIRILGYVLFFWVSIFLTPPYLEQPDILVFTIYLIATGLCVQIVSKPTTWRYLMLGGVLGIGYLTKAVMFPLAFSFLAVPIVRKKWKRTVPGILLSASVFVAICMPFIFELSKSKGRLTYGDAGVVNYRHIMGIDREDGTRLLREAAPKLPIPAATPHIQSYLAILELGTYPPWADPSFGYQGTSTPIDLRRQLNRVHVVLRYYFDLYFVDLGGLTAGMLALLIGGDLRGFGQRFLKYRALWFPAFSGLALYALVRVEGRMLAGFTISLFTACAASLGTITSNYSAKMIRAIVISISILLLSQITITVGHDVLRLLSKGEFPDWEVVTVLREMGIERGDKVSYMGYALSDHAWAHLARLRLSAEIPEEDILSFWSSNEAEKNQVIRWLAATGAKALVTHGVPNTALHMGWRRVNATDYYVLSLSRPPD